MLDKITPIILTFNEESNLHRTLSALDWATDVVVVDSFSTDNTLDICALYPNVRVVQNAFSSHSEQSNFALSQVSNSPWVLSMDADYIVSDELKKEFEALTESSMTNAFRINFKYLMRGKTLRGSLYPPRVCLYKKDFAHYVQDGHTQRVVIDGNVDELNGVLLHDDRKSYSRWFNSQKNYAAQEAIKMSATSWAELSFADRVRFFGLAPFIMLPYTLIGKGLIFNGAAGVEYAFQRFMAELFLIRARLIKKQHKP